MTLQVAFFESKLVCRRGGCCFRIHKQGTAGKKAKLTMIIVMNDRSSEFLCLSTRKEENTRREPRERGTTETKKTFDVHFFRFSFLLPFSLSTSAVEKIPRVNFEKLFPFLERTDSEGRAKEAVRNQLVPQLLSSYQGHKGSITGLLFSERNQVLISSSDDKSVRLWHLGGQVLNSSKLEQRRS